RETHRLEGENILRTEIVLRPPVRRGNLEAGGALEREPLRQAGCKAPEAVPLDQLRRQRSDVHTTLSALARELHRRARLGCPRDGGRPEEGPVGVVAHVCRIDEGAAAGVNEGVVLLREGVLL